MTSDGLDLMFATMSSSFLQLAQAALPMLRQSTMPRVVAVSSFIAHRYDEGPGFTTSSAAKVGLPAIMDSNTKIMDFVLKIMYFRPRWSRLPAVWPDLLLLIGSL